MTFLERIQSNGVSPNFKGVHTRLMKLSTLFLKILFKEYTQAVLYKIFLKKWFK